MTLRELKQVDKKYDDYELTIESYQREQGCKCGQCYEYVEMPVDIDEIREGSKSIHLA